MHVAIRSGFLVENGEPVEIIAGRSRVAPGVLERPGYSEYFDSCVVARGSDSTRTEYRAMTPDGHMVAHDPRA